MASLSGLLSLGCNNNTHSVQATEQLFDKCILLSRPATGTLHPLNRSQSYQHQVAHAEGINIVAYWAARNTIYIFNEHRPSPIFTSISASITASQEASEYRIRTSAAVEQGSTPWWRIHFCQPPDALIVLIFAPRCISITPTQLACDAICQICGDERLRLCVRDRVEV